MRNETYPIMFIVRWYITIIIYSYEMSVVINFDLFSTDNISLIANQTTY